MRSKKVIIIGFDGASYPIIKDLIRRNKMKNFKGFEEDGNIIKLYSTIPPITFPAIPSFITGKNPGKHGIASFFRPKKDRSLGLVDSTRLEGEFWNHGELEKKKKLIVHLPLTYPAKQLKGTIITGPLTPDTYDKRSFLSDTLEKEDVVDNYIIDIDTKYFKGNEKPYYKECVEVASLRKKKIIEMMDRVDWDLSIFYFTFLDRLQHNLMGLDKNKWIDNAYKEADSILGDIMEKCGQDVDLIVFSDHGFGKSRGRFYLNSWLMEKGLLILKNGRSGNRLGSLAKKMQFNPIVTTIFKLLPGTLSQKLIKNASFGKAYDMASVDWEHTRAYATINGIFINVDQDKAKLIGQIKEQLKDDFQLEIDIFERDDIYMGEKIDCMPDIVVSVDNYSYEPFASFEKLGPIQTFDKGSKGWHRREGILLAKGPGFKKGKLDEAEIIDIAPTVLHLMGAHVSKDMDGRVLQEILKAQDKIRYSEDNRLRKTIRELRLKERI